MVLSLWLWGRMVNGRRMLMSVGGLLSLVLLLPILLLSLLGFIRSFL
jgi:hypothetical protein